MKWYYKLCRYYRQVEIVEEELTSKISDMKFLEIMNILNTYGYCDRYNPGKLVDRLSDLGRNRRMYSCTSCMFYLPSHWLTVYCYP